MYWYRLTLVLRFTFTKKCFIDMLAMFAAFYVIVLVQIACMVGTCALFLWVGMPHPVVHILCAVLSCGWALYTILAWNGVARHRI